eukprot:506604_1
MRRSSRWSVRRPSQPQVHEAAQPQVHEPVQQDQTARVAQVDGIVDEVDTVMGVEELLELYQRAVKLYRSEECIGHGLLKCKVYAAAVKVYAKYLKALVNARTAPNDGYRQQKVMANQKLC